MLLVGSSIVVREQIVARHEAEDPRLVPGDYLLAHHDRASDEQHLELILDLSPAVVPGAAVHYRRHGDVTFQVPSRPCALSIVARDPSVTCNHTYVSRLHPGACVVRLVLLVRHTSVAAITTI